MQHTFDFYSDPSHGWLKVPKKLLVEFNLLYTITPYSYERGEYVYLEEDSDANAFYNAYLEVTDTEYKIRSHIADKSSKIRSYRSYKQEDTPAYGKTYALTGATGDKCIANGNSWSESEVIPNES